MRILIRLIGLFRPYRGWMLGGLALSCLTLLANFGLMALSGWFLAATALAGAAGYAAQNAFNFFTPAALVRFFATLRVGSRYGERLVTHEAVFRLLAALRVWFYARLEPLAPAGLQEFRTADLLARLAADVDTLNLFYLRVYVPVLAGLLSALIMAAVFGLFSLAAAAFLLAGLALAGVAMPLLAGWAGRESGAEQVLASAALRTEYIEALQGMEELLVLGAAPRITRRADAGNARLLAAQRRLATLSGFSMAGAQFATNITLLACTLVAGGRVALGTLNPADLPLIALGAAAAFETAAPLPLAFQQLGQIMAAGRRIFALADAPPPVMQPRDAPIPRGFRLELENCSLRYAPDLSFALRDLSLTIDEGERVGITGPTGAGKSTLINLLLRFHEYQQGSARFGGHDLRAYSTEAMARHVTIISQRSHLFSTTIRDNLLLARADATEPELWWALTQAQLAGFVRGLPAGLDSFVGEGGAQLSGGQARRIALARALLRPTPWLVLDEPTEGLDATTERHFLEDLAPLLAGRTVLCISHRLPPLGLMRRVHRLVAGTLQPHDMPLTQIKEITWPSS